VGRPPKISTLARGTAEGAIALELPLGFTIADVEQIEPARSRYPGIAVIQLDPREDWEGDPMAALLGLDADVALVSCVEFGDPVSWPAHEMLWILDASKVVRESADDRALAIKLGEPWLPAIRDLVVVLEHDQLAPSPSVLTMLESAIRPSLGYVYVPIDYAFRALLVQHVAASSPLWSVRWDR